MTEEKKINGMAYMLHVITAIQTKIDDFVTEDGEVVKNTGEFVRRKKVEYLGIEVPPEALVINAKGRIAMTKPSCPQCNSLEIRDNGIRKRKPATIIGDIIVYRLMHVRRKALFGAGLLCLNLWQLLGFIVQLII